VTPGPSDETGKEDAGKMAAAKQAYDAGRDEEALAIWLQLQRNSPNFAITQDVDYWVVLSGLRAGQFELVWEASQRWLAAQPVAVRRAARPTEGAAGSLNWSSRREMLGQVGLAQVQAAYERALSGVDLAEQVQWLTRAETTAQEVQGWQLEPRFAEVLSYHRNLTALQQELRRRDADQPTRLQALQQSLRAAAAAASSAELRDKQNYYAAVSAELLGDLTTAAAIWTQLADEPQVDAEIRHASLFALAEASVNRWLTTAAATPDSAVTADVRRSQLLAARDLYLRLQREAPIYRAASVAFNLGTCYRLLEDHTSAVAQFERIAWPEAQAGTAAPNDAEAGALAWSAQFNLARSLFSLQQWESAVRVLDEVLPRLTWAEASSGGRAVLLRMQLAEKLGQWSQLLALAQDGAAWLQQVPQQQAEVDYLTAVARFQSADTALRSAGAAALQAVASSPQHPFADLARLQLLPWQLEAAQVGTEQLETSGQWRRDLEATITGEYRERLEQAAASATALLDSRDWQIDTFPTNPALWQAEQVQVAARRQQLRQWQANAWFKLARDAEADRAFAALLQDFPQDPAVPEWTIKRAIAIARGDNPAAALPLLAESTLATWSTADQADAWWVVGQLQQLQQDDLAAARACENAWERYAPGPDKPLALQAALAAYQQAKQYEDMLRLIERAEPDATGPEAVALVLQRGVAQYFLQDHAAAEAAFQMVETRAGQLQPSTLAEQQQRDEWVADARVNRGLALQQLGRIGDAKTVWESFLRQTPDHAHHDTVVQWLRGIDPSWTAANLAGASGLDSSGTDHAAVRETSGSLSASPAELRAQAEQAFEAQRWSDSSQALERLVAQTPRPTDHDRILYLWAWALREQQQGAAAIAAWEQLLSEHISSPWVGRSQFHLGEAAYQAKEYVRAKERFQLARTAATEASLQRSALYMEAWSELQQGNFDPARRLFQTLIDAAAPNDKELPLVLEAQALLAQCDFQAGDMAAAVTAYEAASSAVDKLRTLKPELAFQSCLNAGRAAIETNQPGTAILWLNRGQALIDSGNLPAEVDERTRAEVPFLLGVALRLNNQAAAAQQALSQVSGRADAVGLRALYELAQVARAQGDETTARRHYQSIANGAYGDQLPPTAVELKAQALLEVGLSFVRTANQQTDAAIRAEHLRQAKTWLTRAQLQSDSATVSQQAERQLAQLGT